MLNASNIADMPSFLAEHNHELYSVQEVIESVLLPEEIAAKLNLPISTPVLRTERMAFDKHDKIFEYMIYYTKTDNWKYRVQYTKE